MMSFWKKLAQSAIHSFDGAECADCPKGLPGQDPAFATAVTALGAKLAIADGRAHGVEKVAFFNVFQPDEAALDNVERLYDLARQTSHGFESYAARLAKRYAKCPKILEDVLEGLFHIAASDGQISDAEETYLETVASLFGIDAKIYRRIRAGYIALGDDDPYAILGLLPDAHIGDIKRVRTKLLNDFHPDRLKAKGLPEAFRDLYTQKTMGINQAYDQIMTERAL